VVADPAPPNSAEVGTVNPTIASPVCQFVGCRARDQPCPVLHAESPRRCIHKNHEAGVRQSQMYQTL
jgi:hypothetical protein